MTTTRTSDGRIRLGLAGVGDWGRNLLRVAAASGEFELAAICDRDARALVNAVERYPSALAFSDFDKMIAEARLDAVIIATPPSRHHEHAVAALAAGLHVLVEKPLCTSSAQARELVEMARRVERTLMVGHTFLYSNLVADVRERIESGELGEIRCIYSQRLNLGRIRSDVDALWNFAPHDISIVAHLLNAWPVSVNARGASFVQAERGIADVAFFQMDFAGGVLASGHVSWLDPNKVRRVVVVGSERMLVYDDVDAAHPIRIYDKSVEHQFQAASQNYSEFRGKIRAGDLVVPNVPVVEPLTVEIAHFAECIRTGCTPLSDGESGLRVVRVLEAMSLSMRHGGAMVAVDGGQILGAVQDAPASAVTIGRVQMPHVEEADVHPARSES
jgi:predicted dehydrogenase